MPKPILINGLGSRQDILEVSSVKYHRLGTRGVLDDGRVFYYAGNRTASALTRGDFHVGRLLVANHASQTQTTSGGTLTIGATSIQFDVGATALNLGDYEDGFLNINLSTGLGQYYKIRNHTGSAGSTAITIDLYDPIAVAGSATSVVTLQSNPFLDILASTTVSAPAGVPLVTVTAGSADQSATARATTTYYYWLQTRGPCPSNFEGATAAAAIGAPMRQSAATAGRLTGFASGTAESVVVAAYALEAGNATNTRMVHLLGAA